MAFNLRKYSQTEEWYTEKVAETTTDPNILRKILEKCSDDWVSQAASRNPNCPAELLRLVLERGNNNWVSMYAAQNQNCPSDILKMILEKGKDDTVSRFAVTNLNCPLDALRMVLERGKEDIISRVAAKHINCSPELLIMVLERGKDDSVSWNASKNPKCPPYAIIKWKMAIGKIQTESPEHKIQYVNPQKDDSDLKTLQSLIANKKFNLRKYSQTEEWYTAQIAGTTTNHDILRKILEKGENDWVSVYAVVNKNCPPELLRMVLEKGNNDGISRHALENTNCPLDAIIKWKMATGKIQTESPEHKIQYVNPQKDDSDLQKLKDLIANKQFNLRKYSQTEEWYTEEIAENTKDPNILRKILERGNDDRVSQHAVFNKNCSPELLRMVLERGENNFVSRLASNHKNCPVDALKMVLMRGKDDVVSRNAALNKNCPSDVLIMVFERGKDDGVSRNASKNPNSPIDAVIKWKMKTGQIQTESPEHKIQYVNPQKDDSDLKKLKGLIANKQFNLRKYSQTEDLHTVYTTDDQDMLRKILLSDEDNSLTRNAVLNPNCPVDALIMVFERGKKDQVSRYAVSHPNFPQDLFRKVIEQGHHSMLFAMVGNINCPPELLKKIALTRRDVIGQEAILNPNCPAEVFRTIFERNDGHLMISVTTNLNCPTDILKKVLESGRDNRASWKAAGNKNCPPYVLRMVLERGRTDNVSYWASENPNSPIDAVIKWKLKTGKIQTESPENKVQYVNPQKDDSDLKKLRELITSMKFNLNTFKKKASYEGGKGQATKETRGMMNCYKAKMDKGSTAQEAHEQCLKEYNDLNKKGEWATKYV